VIQPPSETHRGPAPSGIQFGRPLFPSPSGGRSTDMRENNVGVKNPRIILRCYQCGFPGVDLDRDNVDADDTGDKNETVTVAGVDANGEVVNTSMDRANVTHGCPWCGSTQGVFGPRGGR